MADYNINAVTRRVVYTGSIGLGPYAFSFEVLDQNDIAVYFNATLLTITTDYTVTINANGTGSVTIVTGSGVPSTPTATDTIVILGARDVERTTDFVTAGDLRAAALNEQLDSNIIFAQQIDERVDRSIKFPAYDSFTGDNILPAKADRADKILKFDTEGNVEAASASSIFANTVVGANFVNDVFTGTGAQTVFTLSTAPGSKNNCQIYIDGVYQEKSTFSINASTLTFTEAPPLNASIEVIIGNAIDSFASDANAINYDQGSTGYVSRTVESKLQETVSVKDFGAVGDGVADDTTALDNALTAARSANKPLYFPAGTYKRTTALQIQDNDKFIGDGRKESIIRFVPPSVITACVVPADDANFTDFCLFENISLTGDPSTPANTPIGIWGKSLRTSRFSQMEFNYFSQNCVYLYGQRTAAGVANPGDSTYNYFEQCRFLSGQDAVRLGGTAGTSRIDSGTSNINTFNKCRFNSATRYGLWMERGANNVFTACSVVSNPNDSGIRVSWYGNSFIGCVAESNGAYGIRFDNETETHDNWVFGLHDGGSNVSGLFQDQNNQNYWFATNKGVHLGYESGSSADNYSMYSKSDGSLYWKNSSGTEIKVSLDANKQTVTGSTGGNAALQNLLSALDTMGIITDSTT